MMSKSKCEPVAKTISIAFLLPLLVFIITIALSEHYLSAHFENKTVCSLLSLLVGLVVSAISVCIARFFVLKGKNN